MISYRERRKIEMRTKLDFQDYEFVIYLFFHSIYCFVVFNFNRAQFEWMLMKLTASGKFERIEKGDNIGE